MTPIAVALGIIILGMLTKFKNDDSSSSKEEKQQQPYRNWNHPEKTTLDKILSIIFPYLIELTNKFVTTCSIFSTSPSLRYCSKSA